jgi:hypothetical protein
MLETFASWLGATPLTAFIENEAWVVPTVQVVHILAITVVMGAVAVINLRILGVIERGQSIGSLAARFVPPSAAAIVVLALTGFLMVAGEPTRAIFRYVFWAKMALLALVLAVTAIMLGGLTAGGIAADPSARAPAAYRVLAGLALLMWLAIIVAGRWIGYAQGWPGSPQ